MAHILLLLLRGKQTIIPPARAKARGKENSPHKVVMEASTGYGPAIAVWKTAVLANYTTTGYIT